MSGRNTHLGVEEGRRWPRKPEKRGRAETLGAKRRERKKGQKNIYRYNGKNLPIYDEKH